MTDCLCIYFKYVYTGGIRFFCPKAQYRWYIQNTKISVSTYFYILKLPPSWCPFGNSNTISLTSSLKCIR